MLCGMTLRFLSRGEIAERLGVTLGTVKQWTTLPEPDVIVGRNQGWAVETVDRWAAQREQSRIITKGMRGGVLDASLIIGGGEPAADDPSRLPAVDCGLGSVRADVRTGPLNSSGREPASLGAAPIGGAGAERPERIGDSRRRGVDRRLRGF